MKKLITMNTIRKWMKYNEDGCFSEKTAFEEIINGLFNSKGEIADKKMDEAFGDIIESVFISAFSKDDERITDEDKIELWDRMAKESYDYIHCIMTDAAWKWIVKGIEEEFESEKKE